MQTGKWPVDISATTQMSRTALLATALLLVASAASAPTPNDGARFQVAAAAPNAAGVGVGFAGWQRINDITVTQPAHAIPDSDGGLIVWNCGDKSAFTLDIGCNVQSFVSARPIVSVSVFVASLLLAMVSTIWANLPQDSTPRRDDLATLEKTAALHDDELEPSDDESTDGGMER